VKYLRVTNVRLPISVDFYRDVEEEKKRIHCEGIFLGAIRYENLQGLSGPVESH
jgi:hypothetical protein